MSVLTGHYVIALAEQETVRSCGMENRMRRAEMTRPIVPKRTMSNKLRIYPVYTLFRNKFPRPAGQGASRQVYGLLGISGSQTGGQGVIDISIPELVQSGQTGISSTWPLNIPGSGSQTQYRLNVPYRFFGLSESLSWLAQFEGQGFEDISALANLVLN
jgi:hypothetical protein